jgi:transcription elongation factor GreA
LADELVLGRTRRAASAAVAEPPRSGGLTSEGLRKLEEELEELEQVRLPELGERIRVIRQMAADLSESGEYFQALDEMSQTQARIAELHFEIGSGDVVTEQRAPAGLVHLGSMVTLAVDGDRETYQVVGSIESDPMKGRISDQSPLGRALLGHVAGDRVKWTSPAGDNEARILKVA